MTYKPPLQSWIWEPRNFFLAVALNDAGFTITRSSRAIRPGREGTHARSPRKWAADSHPHSACWTPRYCGFCVPDREIRGAASAGWSSGCSRGCSRESQIPARVPSKVPSEVPSKVRFAFHSSGALLSRELEASAQAGIAVASVHPLMTFVAGTHPSLTAVPFALEGDHGRRELHGRSSAGWEARVFHCPPRASGIPRMGHANIAAAAGVPGDARRSGLVPPASRVRTLAARASPSSSRLWQTTRASVRRPLLAAR